jgi:HD-GYP domain-containing protein (c-di-GMP phosphodiesterase class II)
LHDIGKLAISNRILDKPGKLTDAEFATVKEHPAYSRRILQQAPCFASIADLASDHHERIDGTGYPRGLGGDRLGAAVRALAIADVYEALTADRPYRGPVRVEKALDIVSGEVPGRLDRAAFSILETWLGRSTELGSRPGVGVLTLGGDLSGRGQKPETRRVVPPRGARRV